MKACGPNHVTMNCQSFPHLFTLSDTDVITKQIQQMKLVNQCVLEDHLWSHFQLQHTTSLRKLKHETFSKFQIVKVLMTSVSVEFLHRSPPSFEVCCQPLLFLVQAKLNSQAAAMGQRWPLMGVKCSKQDRVFVTRS